MDDADRQRIALVLSELVANAAQASESPFHVEVTLSADIVRLSVASKGESSDIPDRSAWGPDHPLSVRGRGLEIVEAVADRVEVLDPAHDTVVIAATLQLAG